MKRLISFLLTVTLVFTLISCSEESSENTSSENASVDESSEESVVLDEFVLSDEVAKINGYLKNDIDRSLLATNVFRGRKYTYSREPGSGYPDTKFKLTDGSSMNAFDKNTFVGWEGRSEANIFFDLGDQTRDIADITVGCLRVMDYGIGLPKYVTLSVSDDGKEYTDIATINTPSNIPQSMKYEYAFALPKTINAQYIRIKCGPQDNAFLFIDEICAYQYSKRGTIDRSFGVETDQIYTVNDFYNYNLNLGESDVKVSESDDDYNKKQNLAQLEGVDFQVYHFDPLKADHTNTSIEKVGILADGELHGKLSTAYFNCQRGGGRHIVCDVGHIMSVSGATFSFYDRHTWGVSTPPAYYVSLSENGEDWTTVYSYYKENYGSEEIIEDTHKITFADDYRARYVRITFETVPDNSISSSVYLGEFEVIGKKNPEGAVAAVEDDSPYGKFVSTEKYGINNLLFAPITDGYGKHCTTTHVMSEESAYIYLATFGEDGKANGVFMDSIAFSTRGALNDHTDRNEGMNWFFDELFYEGLNLDAVEAAKGKLNKELGTDDKVKIWVSINAPAAKDTFNGNRVSTEEDYNACVEWQIDETLRRFSEKNYQNLEFVGFYWQFETVRTLRDVKGMTHFNDYVHNKGYMTLWCPYYSAKGIYYNHQVGFDIACLQPNYMFYDTEPTRMYTTAERAKIYGMCVEIEIEAQAHTEDTLKLYRDYLRAGYDTGFMESIKMYYQGGLPGEYVTGYDSTDKYHKAIYDETILYAMCKLDDDYNKGTLVGIEQFKDGEITVCHGRTASLELGDLSNCSYRFVSVPVFGAIRLDENGKLTYSAMEGYSGEDTVKIEIFDGVSETKIITVKVTVTEE